MDGTIEQLAQRCAEETERFFGKRQAPDNRFCFELFRRAFVEKSEAAWECVYQNYQPLVASWIREHPQLMLSGEEVDYFLNGVFTAMWRSCTAERFARFGELPSVLAYLKSCVHTVIFNHTRKQHPPTTHMHEELIEQPGSPPTTHAVLDKMARAELWRLLDSLLNSEKERMVLELHFINGLKPREIYETQEAHFANIQDVYRVKQNLLERLSRNESLRAFYEDNA